MLRKIVFVSSLVMSAVLLAGSFGCGPSPQGGGSGSSTSSSQAVPELTKEVIDERINDAGVWEVPPESGTGEPISWRFDYDEPKEIVVVDQQMDGSKATLILDIKTQSAPRSSNLRVLSGQIRTDWRLETGWVLRRWEIVETDNISMKYRDLPKLPSPSTVR